MTRAITDPIFGKIEAHRAAVEAMNAAFDISCKMGAEDSAFKDADRKSTKASNLEMKALRALIGCRPTTLAGAIALLDHLGQPHTLRNTDGNLDTVLSLAHQWSEDKDEVRTLPHQLAAALRSLVGRPALGRRRGWKPAVASLWGTAPRWCPFLPILLTSPASCGAFSCETLRQSFCSKVKCGAYSVPRTDEDP
jgi:hypothetical protein